MVVVDDSVGSADVASTVSCETVPGNGREPPAGVLSAFSRAAEGGRIRTLQAGAAIIPSGRASAAASVRATIAWRTAAPAPRATITAMAPIARMTVAFMTIITTKADELSAPEK